MDDHISGTANLDMLEVPRRRLERANPWVSLIANVGVVIGLFVLIFEVRQNAALTRISLEAERTRAHSDIELHLSDPEIAEVWMKAIYAEEKLNRTDLRVVDGIFVSVTLLWDRLLTMKGESLVDRRRMEQNIRNTAPFYFGSPLGKRWWKENAQGYEGTDLYDIANPIILNVEDDFIEQYYNGLRHPHMNANSSDITEDADVAE